MVNGGLSLADVGREVRRRIPTARTAAALPRPAGTAAGRVGVAASLGLQCLGHPSSLRSAPGRTPRAHHRLALRWRHVRRDRISDRRRPPSREPIDVHRRSRRSRSGSASPDDPDEDAGPPARRVPRAGGSCWRRPLRRRAWPAAAVLGSLAAGGSSSQKDATLTTPGAGGRAAASTTARRARPPPTTCAAALRRRASTSTRASARSTPTRGGRPQRPVLRGHGVALVAGAGPGHAVRADRRRAGAVDGLHEVPRRRARRHDEVRDHRRRGRRTWRCAAGPTTAASAMAMFPGRSADEAAAPDARDARRRSEPRLSQRRSAPRLTRGAVLFAREYKLRATP